LVDAGLIGAERTAALEHERDTIATLRPPSMRGDGLVDGLGVHYVLNTLITRMATDCVGLHDAPMTRALHGGAPSSEILHTTVRRLVLIVCIATACKGEADAVR